jgi:hypothetical protein
VQSTNTVNIGVSELRMAATDESICRCAKAKKKEGKKVPKKPVIINHFHLIAIKPFKDLKPKISKKIVLITIRALPNSMGESPTSHV